MKNFSTILMALTIFCCGFTNCNYSNVETKIKTSESSAITFESSQEGKIAGSEEALWKASFSTVRTNEYLKHLQKFNKKDFYVLGENQNLYKTSNEGNT